MRTTGRARTGDDENSDGHGRDGYDGVRGDGRRGGRGCDDARGRGQRGDDRVRDGWRYGDGHDARHGRPTLPQQSTA